MATFFGDLSWFWDHLLLLASQHVPLALAVRHGRGQTGNLFINFVLFSGFGGSFLLGISVVFASGEIETPDLVTLGWFVSSSPGVPRACAGRVSLQKNGQKFSVMRVGSNTFGDPIFQGLTKLAILPDYKCPGLICLALPAGRKFGLILVIKSFLVEVMKKSS